MSKPLRSGKVCCASTALLVFNLKIMFITSLLPLPNCLSMYVTHSQVRRTSKTGISFLPAIFLISFSYKSILFAWKLDKYIFFF